MQPLSCDLWLMERHAFRQFLSLASVRLDAESAKAAASVTPKRQSGTNRCVGVIPVHGPLEARASFIGEMIGIASYERIGQTFDALLADDSVTGILMDFATPGGMVYGCSELANKIFDARGRKKDGIIASVNPMACSGGYWLAAACERIIASPSADVGSVGVIAEHVDLSKSLEEDGAKVTVIRSSQSPYKAETNETEPLTDEAKASLQARADKICQQFIGDLARFRGVSVQTVEEHFGKGRMVDTKTAMAAGMVDRIEPFQKTAEKMATGRFRMGVTADLDDWNVPTLKETRRGRAGALQLLADANGETA